MFCQIISSHMFHRIFFFRFFIVIFDIIFILSNQMISFDQFVFVFNNRCIRYIIQIVNRARQQQFAMLMNFYKIIILFSHFANSTKTTFKRFFNDVTNIVNNVFFNKRDKKTKYQKNSIFVSQSIFYNFIFF